MNMLILSAPASATLDALNASGEAGRQLRPVTLTDSRLALNADLLLDCAAGQTWEHYGAFLTGLTAENVATLPIYEV
jgi:hypothetical protein